MDVTRSAIVKKNYNRMEKEEAISLAKKLGGKLCSLRYCANHMECTFGFGVYKNDELIGWKSEDYFWA